MRPLAGASLAAAFATPALARPQAPAYQPGQCGTFTVAMIPDTQNSTDFTRQKSHGFPIDAVELYYEQMRYIGDNARSNGGDIVFATHVGDIWQHYSEWMDPEHEARGFKWVPNPAGSSVARQPYAEVRSFGSQRRRRLSPDRRQASVLSGARQPRLRAVDPPRLPPRRAGRRGGPAPRGRTHRVPVGVLGRFGFFRDQPWYISATAAHQRAGVQAGSAGSCTSACGTAHRMTRLPGRAGWSSESGIPTIVTIHKYLNRAGERAVGGSPT